MSRDIMAETWGVGRVTWILRVTQDNNNRRYIVIQRVGKKVQTLTFTPLEVDELVKRLTKAKQALPPK